MVLVRLSPTSELWVGSPASGEPYPQAHGSAPIFQILISDSGSAFWFHFRSGYLVNWPMIVLGLFDCPVERFPVVLFPDPDPDIFLVVFLAYCAERQR